MGFPTETTLKKLFVNPKLQLTLVLIISILFALSYGFNYGISNHNTYLLHGLRLFNPEILQYDWLASETTSYHPIYSFIVYLFYSIDTSGWLFAIANLLSIIAGHWVLYKIIREISDSNASALLSFVGVSAIALVTLTYSVSDSFIYSKIFQASTLGALGLLLAILFYLRQEYFKSSLWIAIFGVAHANFLILAFPLFFIAHVIYSKRLPIVDLFKQFTLPFLALGMILPIILDTMQDPLGAEGKAIFQQIVAPFHYVPMTFLSEFIPYLAWQALGFSLGWKMLQQSQQLKAFNSVLLSIMLLIGIATLLTTVIFIPTVSQLYFWRLAPFSDLFFQSIILLAIVQSVLKGQNPFSSKLSMIIASVSGLILLYVYIIETKAFLITFLLLTGLIIAATQKISRPYFFSVGCICVIFSMCYLPVIRDNVERSSLLTGMPEAQAELFAWAKQNTADDAQFLVSPQLYNFRLHAQRAVIVDKKSTPILGSELVEWYTRIQTVSQTPQVESLELAIAAYEKLTPTQLLSINQKYTYDFAILSSEVQSDQFQLVFNNADYWVYRLIK